MPLAFQKIFKAKTTTTVRNYIYSIWNLNDIDRIWKLQWSQEREQKLKIIYLRRTNLYHFNLFSQFHGQELLLTVFFLFLITLSIENDQIYAVYQENGGPETIFKVCCIQVQLAAQDAKKYKRVGRFATHSWAVLGSPPTGQFFFLKVCALR